MDALLTRLEGTLGPREGDAVALHGGITNRNYRVRMGGVDYVVRISGKDTHLLGIDREAERAASESAYLAGVAPAVAAFVADEECLVTAFVSGRTLGPGDVRAQLPRVAAALLVMHAGPAVPVVFSPFRIAERYLVLTRARGGRVPAACAEAAVVAGRLEEALGAGERVLCHNDLLPANFLDDGDRLWIIDWEYAGMGDPRFDLGNLSVNNGFTLDDDRALVAAYYGEVDERRLAQLRLMRAVSDWREATWGVVQQTISDLDFDFRGYAEEHLERMLASDWEGWIDGATA